MNIFVCLKQVPGTNAVQVDEKTGVLRREGVSSKLNPYDLFALETALRLREAHGGKVSVGTMGPPQSREIIFEAYMMGADEGFVFSDRNLGGSDVLATSYALFQGICAVGDFDLIVCGKQTTDGDTAQVGPALAEQMGIAHAAWVSALSADENGVTVMQKLESSEETAYIPFPCLISVEKDIYTPRLPSLKRAREAKERAITVLGIADFMDKDPSHYGLFGSATRVERIFPPESGKERETWPELGAAEKLKDALCRWKYI